VGLLLDTNAMIWFLAEEPMEAAALYAIAEAQAAGQLYVSPISAWEAALALAKPSRQPNLSGQDAATWFKKGRKQLGARLLTPGIAVGLEAARVPAIYGSGDPGDCYIIASARVGRHTVVTRDRRMRSLHARLPAYLATIGC
jgi:PIN domain nuclease of toxin-antitoxin system